MGAPVLKLAKDLALPLEVVSEASAIVATRGAGKSSASAVITEEVFELGVQVVIFDRTGVYWGLRSNARGTGPGLGVYVLGGPHGDVPLEPHAGVLIADLAVDSGHSFVLDLSDFSKSAAIRFAADFLERLYDRKARARSTTLLVIDEAHFYAPQTPRGGFKGDSARLMGAMEDTVGLGRSRGLGVVLTTQRTQALNKAILDLIETLLVMRMLSPRARDAVQDWIREKHEDDREGVIETLDSLPTGTAWVWSPLRGVLAKIAVRRIRTFDSYATPKPGETRVEPSARRELDLDALGERMRASVERAKAEDPAELRKQIRDLQRQVAERPEPEAERVEVPVEVPVVPDEVARALEPIREAAAKIAAATATITAEADAAREAIRAAAGQSRRVSESLRPVSSTPEPSVRDGRTATIPTRREPVRAAGPAVESNGARSSAETRQKVLDALAWWEEVGVTPVSRLQLAMVAGYHPRTGTFAQALADLAEGEAVTYPDRGQVALLPPGRATATVPAWAPSSEALQEMVYRQVGEKRAEALREIVACHPEPIARVELADRLGYHPRTGTFAQVLADLKALGVIEFPRPGAVRAASMLFLRPDQAA